MSDGYWQNIQDLLQDTKYRNVILVGNNGTIRAHQIVLSMFSPLLKIILHEQIIGNDGKTPVILLPDFTTQCICGMLNLLYSGEIQGLHENLLGILDLMQVLQLTLSDLTMVEFAVIPAKLQSEVLETPMIVTLQTPLGDGFLDPSDETSDDEPLINFVGLYDIFAAKEPEESVKTNKNKSRKKRTKKIKQEGDDTVKSKRGRKSISTNENCFPCSLCGKVFNKKPRLERHMSSHRGERPFSCEICGKTFREKGNLSEHLLIHSGEKHFQCEICAQLFRKKFAYMRHKVVHTGEKAHQCDVCGKAFSLKQMLEAHTRIHSGERPYCCEICGKAFRQKAHLTTHMKVHSTSKNSGVDNLEVNTTVQVQAVQSMGTLLDMGTLRIDTSNNNVMAQV